MTPNAILTKLNTILADPIDSECKVVYVLCEIRKFQDKLPADQRPFALNMYCHWALHIDLSGTGTIMAFLTRLDEFVDGYLVGPEDVAARNRMALELFFRDTFKSQLHEFFVTNGVRTDLTDNDARWNEFVKHYAGVIEEGSLVYRAQGLKHVKQVTFTKSRDATGELAQMMPFDMRWRVALVDGRRFDIDVNARRGDKGPPLIDLGVQLH